LRRVAKWVAALLAVLLLALAVLAGMATTTTGFRWLGDAAAYVSGGKLRVQGLEGHLGVPIRIGQLVFTSDTQRVTLERVRLEWRPRALLQGRLDIGLLAAQSVRIDILKKDTTPPTLPTSLRSPVDVRVDAWDVARLDVADAGGTLSFKNLHGRIEADGDRYRFTGMAATTPWADVRGRLELGMNAPFALQGRFDAVRSEPIPVNATLGLQGRLAAIAFRFEAQAKSMRFMASGEAAPFARVRLPHLLVAGQGIDPRLFAADAPTADLCSKASRASACWATSASATGRPAASIRIGCHLPT